MTSVERHLQMIKDENWRGRLMHWKRIAQNGERWGRRMLNSECD